MGLTDHGNMSGTVQLYKEGKKRGVQVFPGFEGYLVDTIGDKDSKRYHFGLLAADLAGFRSLLAFSSLAHSRPRFHRFPRHDLSDLATLAGDGASSGLVFLSGCYFGLLQQTLVSKGYEEAKQVAEMYAGWFPNTFVEVQNHSTKHPDGWTDDDIVEVLIDIAGEVGLPVVATQDSHYLAPSDRQAHNMMKRMGYRNGDESEFPGDSFHFASTEWVKRHYTKSQWELSEEGHAAVLALHDLSIPVLDEYRPHVPKMSKTPEQDLRNKVYAGLKNHQDNLATIEDSTGKYRDRLLYEMGIINKLGYADYFLHVLDLVRFCNDRKICIEARGSANASLVCFCLGITQVDPIQWGLTFERFLSLDRQKPPDIDIDIEDVRRGELVGYIRSRYGAVSIGNYAQMGARADDDKGSILVSYNSYLRSQMSPARFNQLYGTGLETIADVADVSLRDYRGLRKLAKSVPFRSYGVHASGLLLPAGNVKISDYIPTMLVASSDTVVTQYNMEDVEQTGLLKDDVLGQRTLWVMARCQELMGRQEKDDFSWIPVDDAETCSALSEGRVNNAVFQFEGYAMAKGAQTMGIKSTMDCILAASLFRPACMESGVTDLYLKRRANRALRANIRYPHPAFEQALKPTYGCVLFQEQVLQIMRSLGLDYAGINTFFKIVKDSGKGATGRNIGRANEVKKQWRGICKKNGIKDTDGAWHYIEGYVKYGFNKAHATGYGIRSYRCAYLKTHFPLEFMTAALESVAGKNTGKVDKEAMYIREARRIGIRILPPDVNISGARWTMASSGRNAITHGMASIKGISVERAVSIVAGRPGSGWKDARELAEGFSAAVLPGRQQYLDLVNGVEYKSGPRKGQSKGSWTGVMKALKEAGALESLGVGRDD
jgi:DNA polymerase-3 subunit alpha